ncbi:MAG TPA: YHS domain-containing protein [Dongiaceae bacterium]|nr:YHS domain-containing protein [Dongiaceae bacterium]
MGFLGRVVRFLFWVLIASWALRLIARAFSGAASGTSKGARSAPEEAGELSRGRKLVKDPVCGVHVAENLALPMKAGGETFYFCSQECRQRFESNLLAQAKSA